jgi:hypothetical protein
LCKRRIEAAINLYGDARISREEYLRHVELNEREIAIWEAKTTDEEKAALETALCVDAIRKLVQIWEDGTPEDKQGIARNMFSYLVYDLDTRRIVDFRLKSWVDRYLTLRTALYQEEANEIQSVENGTSSEFKQDAEEMVPEGFRTIPRPYISCSILCRHAAFHRAPHRCETPKNKVQ